MSYIEIDQTISIDSSDILDSLHWNSEALQFAKDIADQLEVEDLAALLAHVKGLLAEL